MSNITDIPNSTIKIVNFYGQDIRTFIHKTKPWVCMREIIEGIGLSRNTQIKKIKARSLYKAETLSVRSGNYFREALCMPLQKLPLYLASIDENRVSEKVKSKVLQYQEECSVVLSDYWFEGRATNQRMYSEAWQKDRAEGKVTRNEEVSVVKDFVEYAINQGSTNAGYYYRNITRMTYTALDIIEQFNAPCRGIRDFLESAKLRALVHAEDTVRFSIQEGMELGLPYKDIYQKAKNDVLILSKAMSELSFNKPRLVVNND